MPAQRIKGQEVSLLMLQDGQIVQSINAIKDSDFTPEFDLLEEGYLGETTDRYDEIMKGWSGKLMVHMADEGIFTFLNSIIDVATRRVPGTVFNLKATLNFPNGDRPRLVFKELHFGALPFNVGSRNAYVAQTLNWKCGSYQLIPS